MMTMGTPKPPLALALITLYLLSIFSLSATAHKDPSTPRAYHLRHSRRSLSSPPATLWDLLHSFSSSAKPSSTLPKHQHDDNSLFTAFDTTVDTTAASKINVKNVVRDIMAPPMDKSSYEYFELENGMKLVLCSDPEMSQAAAAVDVHVGATSDPDDIPGLAHFNEHMLFLGTEKYPDEESFSAFIEGHNGFSNAYTDSEDTVYFFGMDGSHFEEGLDRFASFFVAPLLTENATARELNAINSENAKNLQNDGFRRFQLDKARISNAHPYHKFFTGSKYTLKDQVAGKNIDLHAELVKFYQAHYHAEAMTAAVTGPQSLEELREYAVKAFSGVKSLKEKTGEVWVEPEKAWGGKVLPYDGEGVIPAREHTVTVIPVSDVRKIDITWPVMYSPESITREEDKWVSPSAYLSNLMGHEGPNSLLSHLKSKGWANGLSAGQDTSLSDFFEFQTSVSLTEEGLSKIPDIIEYVFSYLDILKKDSSLPDHTYNERITLSDLAWKYRTKSDSVSDYAVSLATALREYPPRLVVAGPRRAGLQLSTSPSEGDGFLTERSAVRQGLDPDQRAVAEQSVKRLLKYLTVQNSMITVTSKQFEKEADKTEFWYGTKYSVAPFSADLKTKWETPQDISSVVGYPAPNKYLPTEEGLKVLAPPPVAETEKDVTNGREDAGVEYVEPPTVIREGRDMTAFYKLDNRFNEPKAVVQILVERKGVYGSPKDVIHNRLYMQSAKDHLNEEVYSADQAGLAYDFEIHSRGINLSFGGYNQHLPLFTANVICAINPSCDSSGDSISGGSGTEMLFSDSMASLLPKDQKEFDRYKDNIRRGLASFDVKQPYELAMTYAALTQTPLHEAYDNASLRKALEEEVTLSSLQEYTSTLFSSGRAKILIHGNVDRETADDLLDSISRTLSLPSKMSEEDLPPRASVLPLPAGTPTQLTILTPNPQDPNAASITSFQSLEKDDITHVAMALIGKIVYSPYYDDLRTKRQLGYIVSSGVKSIPGNRRKLLFIAQSSVANASTLTDLTMNFLRNTADGLIENLPEEHLKDLTRGIHSQLTDKDKTLGDEAERHWGEIVTGELRFNYLQEMVTAVDAITKDDVVRVWNDLTGDRTKRVLVSEIVPNEGDAANDIEPKKSYFERADFEERNGTMSNNGVKRIGIDDIDQYRQILKADVVEEK